MLALENRHAVLDHMTGVVRRARRAGDDSAQDPHHPTSVQGNVA